LVLFFKKELLAFPCCATIIPIEDKPIGFRHTRACVATQRNLCAAALGALVPRLPTLKREESMDRYVEWLVGRA